MVSSSKDFFQRATPQIDREKCSNCGLCVKVCGGQPLVLTDGKVEIDAKSAMGCFGCGQCMMVCPTGAVTVTGRNLTSKDLLEPLSSSPRASADQLDALLIGRRSIRRFKPVEVERAVVDRIVRTASTAPMGIPPSDVGMIIFHGRDKVKAFSDDVLGTIDRTMKHVNSATLPLFRLFMKRADYESFKEFVLPLGSVFEEDRARGDDPLLYGAPVAILFHRSPYSELADCHVAATYAMIAAESLGLGTCMIGLVAPFMARDKGLMKKYGVPEGNVLSLVLLIGHPGVSFKKNIKRRFASVVFYGDRADAST